MGTQEVTYRKSPWFDDARELLQRSERGSPDQLDWIENQIRSGEVLLYVVEQPVKGMQPGQPSSDFRQLGIFTARPEVLHNGDREMFIIHAVSTEPTEIPFICMLYPVITDLCKKSEIGSWRVNSKRPGMAKRLLQHGFEYQESIFTRKVV